LHFATGASGGFILGRGFSAMDNIREFVEYVVPELQRRGLSKKTYAGPTLRENLNAQAWTRGSRFAKESWRAVATGGPSALGRLSTPARWAAPADSRAGFQDQMR